MRQGVVRRFGPAAEVVAIERAPDPPAPGAGEVLVSVELSPIEQADLHRAEGRFADRALPYLGGLEGMGRVVAAGEATLALRPGDRVLLPPLVGAWRERLLLPAAGLIRLPPGDPLALGQLTVNPPTAWLILRAASLAPGDWVIQNAAASSCGRYLIGLARWMGFRTLNVVRRPEHEPALRALGADAVLVDGPDLAERAAAITGPEGARLAVDAVGGAATGRLVATLGDGGELVVYGMLAGEPCLVDPHHLVHRGVSARGFFLGAWLAEAQAGERAETYATLATLIAEGRIASPVEAVYPLDRVRDALTHAARPGRTGRIALSPDGSLVTA